MHSHGQSFESVWARTQTEKPSWDETTWSQLAFFACLLSCFTNHTSLWNIKVSGYGLIALISCIHAVLQYLHCICSPAIHLCVCVCARVCIHLPSVCCMHDELYFASACVHNYPLCQWGANTTHLDVGLPITLGPMKMEKLETGNHSSKLYNCKQLTWFQKGLSSQPWPY